MSWNRRAATLAPCDSNSSSATAIHPLASSAVRTEPRSRSRAGLSCSRRSRASRARGTRRSPARHPIRLTASTPTSYTRRRSSGAMPTTKGFERCFVVCLWLRLAATGLILMATSIATANQPLRFTDGWGGSGPSPHRHRNDFCAHHQILPGHSRSVFVDAARRAISSRAPSTARRSTRSIPIPPDPGTTGTGSRPFARPMSAR
jgi:hypothetical protein